MSHWTEKLLGGFMESSQSVITKTIMSANTRPQYDHYVEIVLKNGETLHHKNCNLNYLFTEKDFININHIEEDEILIRDYYNRSEVVSIRTEYGIKK
jgi:hypothetical protein